MICTLSVVPKLVRFHIGVGHIMLFLVGKSNEIISSIKFTSIIYKIETLVSAFLLQRNEAIDFSI